MAIANDDPNVPKAYRGMTVPGFKGKKPAPAAPGTSGAYNLGKDIKEYFNGANARARGPGDRDVDIEGMAERGLKEAKDTAKAHADAQRARAKSHEEWVGDVTQAGSGGDPKTKKVIEGVMGRIAKRSAARYEI